jgi:hypothetical protein
MLIISWMDMALVFYFGNDAVDEVDPFVLAVKDPLGEGILDAS